MPVSIAKLGALCAMVVVAAAQAPAAPVAGQVAQAASAAAPISPLAAKYANMPTLWPDPDQTKGAINVPDLLKSPLVQDGMKRVTAAVPANILALQPAVKNGDTITYPAGKAGADGGCYAQMQCNRTVAANGYQPDVTACLGDNEWALTYDDGPSVNEQANPSTVTLLEELSKMNQTSTFFVAGSSSFYNPTVLKRIHEELHHEVAVHTWTHPPLTTLTNEQIVAEILYTEAWIVRTLGVKPRFFRPPFGDADDRVRAIIGALGYNNIMWAFDSMDSHTTDVNAVVNVAKSWFHPQKGFIALEHSLSNVTNAMSIAVLQAVQQTPNFPLKLTTVGACIGMDPYIDVASAAAAAAPPTTAPTKSASPPKPSSGASGSSGSPKSTGTSTPAGQTGAAGRMSSNVAVMVGVGLSSAVLAMLM
ncbi:hypothetical protein SpCBS45565_g05169 [Spizellomyces sp. 'palustris']|nr:hypothetical protein SpCBS45565_g05169 [Spizellomyces sp. 'palustris']